MNTPSSDLVQDLGNKTSATNQLSHAKCKVNMLEKISLKKNGYDDHYVFQNDPNICKSKRYGLTVHWEPLEAIMSEKDTFVRMQVRANDPHGCTINQTHIVQRQFSQATCYNS